MISKSNKEINKNVELNNFQLTKKDVIWCQILITSITFIHLIYIANLLIKINLIDNKS